MPAAAAIGPDGQIMRPRKGRPPKGGYPFPYPASTDPARTIYIGKNNARHWADLKTRLGYNGDVDFVSFLLRLAEERLSQEEQMCESGKPKRPMNGQSQRSADVDERRRRLAPDEKDANGVVVGVVGVVGHEPAEDEQRKKLKLEDGRATAGADDEDDEHHHGYDYNHSEGVSSAPSAAAAAAGAGPGPGAPTAAFAPSSSSEREHEHAHSFAHASDDEDEDNLVDDEDDNSLANTSTSAAGEEQSGEYICNFCNKSFLRPTYLNVHRTYGCPANPDRCRPQCHVCGKDFSQPQKLKAHIEAEHAGSDYAHCDDGSSLGGMSGGSGGSQQQQHHPCKACPAVFSTRAALRRHLGEIHGQGASGTCVCDQCGKLFQTKSNLKIHLLTHSGVKPFKCPEGECGLGFSTKQCLQVHLRKAHGFSEENMPPVQRTIPYTFDAYSGGVIKDPGRGKLPDCGGGGGGSTPGRLSSLDHHQDGSNPAGTPRPAYPIPEMPRRGRKPGWRKANSVNGQSHHQQQQQQQQSQQQHQSHELHQQQSAHMQQQANVLNSPDEMLHKMRHDKDDMPTGGPLPPFSSAAAVVAELAIQSLAAAAAAASAAESPDHADLHSPSGGAPVNYHSSPGPMPMTPEPQAMALNLAASRNQSTYEYPPASPSPWQQGQQQQQHFDDGYPSLARPQAVSARTTPGPPGPQQQQQAFYPERPSSCYSFDGQQQGYNAILQPPATPVYNAKLAPSSPQQDPSRCATPLAETSFARFAAAAAAAAAASSTPTQRCPSTSSNSPGANVPSSTGAGTGSSSSNPYPSPAPSPGYASVTSRVFSGSYGLQNWGNVNVQGLSGYSQTYPLPPPSPYPRNPYGGYY